MTLYDDLEIVDVKSLYGVFTDDQKEIVDHWNELLGDETALSFTIFRDADFVSKFLEIIPKDIQYNYVVNTYNKYMNYPYDEDYVLVSRRSIPSDEAKPEAFWTTEHNEALNGLKEELPIGSPARMHTYIMVTTLGKLKKHGLSDTYNGGSDGEIVINPTKPFNDFLFTYKPQREKGELDYYLYAGGIEKEKLLEYYKETAEERLITQGFSSHTR